MFDPITPAALSAALLAEDCTLPLHACPDCLTETETDERCPDCDAAHVARKISRAAWHTVGIRTVGATAGDEDWDISAHVIDCHEPIMDEDATIDRLLAEEARWLAL